MYKNLETQRAYNLAWRAKNRDAIREKARREYREKYLARKVASARYRAEVKGIPFDIDLADVSIPARCPVLGIPLKISPGRTGGGRPNSPALDRIDNSKGYVKGNVFVISQRANALKSDATIDEVRAVLRYMENHYFSP